VRIPNVNKSRIVITTCISFIVHFANILNDSCIQTCVVIEHWLLGVVCNLVAIIADI